jgi:hypothetical protein
MAEMRRTALKVLHQEANGLGPDTRTSARVAAAVAIGKLTDVDLFTDHKVIEHRSDNRLLALQTKLETRLKALFDKAGSSPNPLALPEPQDDQTS